MQREVDAICHIPHPDLCGHNDRHRGGIFIAAFGGRSTL
jgi:hypothetical protein